MAGPTLLLGLGIRSYVRIARRARAAGKLEPGPADTNGNAASVYGYAFSAAGRSTDSKVREVLDARPARPDPG